MNPSELIARLRDLSKMLDEYEGGNFKWSEEAATAREAADALQALERVPMTDAELIDILTPIGAAWLMDEADECSQINAIRAIAEAARMKD